MFGKPYVSDWACYVWDIQSFHRLKTYDKYFLKLSSYKNQTQHRAPVWSEKSHSVKRRVFKQIRLSSSGHQSDPGDDCASNSANEYHLLSNHPEYPGNPKASDYTEHPSNRWTPSIRTHILHERPDSSACERRTNESKMGFREMNYGIMNILTGLLVTCRRTGIFTRFCSDSSCSISHNDSIKWWCKPYCFFHRCQISTIKSKFV